MNRVAEDFVEHEGKHFRVSTINRESSSMYGGRYAETFVFEWFPEREGKKQGAFVAQDAASEDSRAGHDRMCDAFKKFGKVPEND